MGNFGFLSLIPAIITIVVAIISRRVAWALFFGVTGGALVVSKFEISPWVNSLFNYIFGAFGDRERVEIALFVILIGGLLEVIAESGAYEKFAEKIATFLNNGRKARVATWFLSLCLFFDDYANVLISGASMKPVLKRYNVTPALLAYMVDIIAGFASVMLISTWAAYEGSLMIDAANIVGIKSTTTQLFLGSLPYHIYTFLAIALAFLVAYTGRWFGSRLETKEIEEKNSAKKIDSNASFYHVLAPIMLLVFLAVSGLFVTGYFAVASDPKLEPTLINILGNAPTIDVLVFATVASIALAVALILKDRVLPASRIRKSFVRGLKEMLPIGAVIMLASSLASVSADLGTGLYITDLLKGFITPSILPALIYIIAALITVATGFSWSSMAIVMPVAYQLAMAQHNPAMIPVVSAAVISGAITGAQIAPYSDKTVMTAAACGLSPLYHAKTQLFQVLLVALTSAVLYVAYGYGLPISLCYAAGLIIILFAHFTLSPKRNEEI